VASTKGFTCQLTVLALLALKAAHQRGALDDRGLAEKLAHLRNMPGLINQALAMEPVIKTVARKIATATDAIYLGRGPMYPLAMEGALKLKEISYIHAEGYASGELPECDPFLAPILYAVPAQLLSYHAAVAKGTDVDQPRNLAKSVTVE